MNRFCVFVSDRLAGLVRAYLFVFLSAFLFVSQSSAESGGHHEAYLEALDKVLVAEARISAEMDQISSRTVAHYDFLQHEHIELLRHARALRYPPSRLSVSGKESVIARANAVLKAAESLELVISDFLRAQALLNSAVNNTLDLVATQTNQGMISADPDHLQQLTLAAKAFKTDNTPETLAVLDSAFGRILSLKADSAPYRELRVQQQLILGNASEPAAARSRLIDSNVALFAEALHAAYLASQDY